MLMRRRIVLGALAALSSVAVDPAPAGAHAFGERYDLPLPLELYLIGAGAAVGLSFVVMAFFLTKQHVGGTAPRVRAWRISSMTGFAYTAVRTALECLSVGIFLLIIATGFFGSEEPAHNFAPVMVWVVWWVGMAFVSALLGDLWRLINPWSIIFRWFETLLGRLPPDRKLVGRRRYPGWLGVWPAVLLFVIYAWLELLWVGRSQPSLYFF